MKENNIKEDIEKVENLIKRCDECKLKECINCETNWTEVTSIKRIVDSYKKELKDLQEYKRISELTKISCCTAQNCEALNNAIREGIENQKLKQENEELKADLYSANSIINEYIDTFKNCIQKQKIKDKIEELENANWYRESVKNQTIRALKELKEWKK